MCHTPGPWIWRTKKENPGDREPEDGVEDWAELRSTNECFVCHPAGECGPDDLWSYRILNVETRGHLRTCPDRDDRNLIGAAPDLLKACKMALQPSNDLTFGTQQAMLIAIARTKRGFPGSVNLHDACRTIIEAPTPEVLDIGVLRSAKRCFDRHYK